MLVVILDARAQGQHVTIGRREDSAFRAFPYFNRFQHADAAAGSALCLLAGFHEKFIEDRGRAIHDRYFRTIDLDAQVVDAKAGDCRQQVLDDCDRGAMIVAERRAELRIGNAFSMREDFASAGRCVSAHEADT